MKQTETTHVEYIVILITAPSWDEASQLGDTLVGEKLAACCTAISHARSTYRWQGDIAHDEEVLLLVKTRASLFDRVAVRVRELHSYEVPEIIALPVVAGSQPYLRWIDTETDATSGPYSPPKTISEAERQ